MTAMPVSRDARTAFEEALLCALTEGRIPSAQGDFGMATRSALDAIAKQHPEAEVVLISEAYDAFEQEHGQVA
jgi:hypothetical protein